MRRTITLHRRACDDDLDAGTATRRDGYNVVQRSTARTRDYSKATREEWNRTLARFIHQTIRLETLDGRKHRFAVQPVPFRLELRDAELNLSMRRIELHLGNCEHFHSIIRGRRHSALVLV